MKLFELVGLFLFASFVLNVIQYDKDRTRCEKVEYQAKGCSIFKKVKEVGNKKLKVSFE